MTRVKFIYKNLSVNSVARRLSTSLVPLSTYGVVILFCLILLACFSTQIALWLNIRPSFFQGTSNKIYKKKRLKNKDLPIKRNQNNTKVVLSEKTREIVCNFKNQPYILYVLYVMWYIPSMCYIVIYTSHKICYTRLIPLIVSEVYGWSILFRIFTLVAQRKNIWKDFPFQNHPT